MRFACKGPAPQRGMALVLSLIFLAIITLVSLSSMQGATTQGRMAANQQDYSVALQAAEAALHEAEKQLQSDAQPSPNWVNHQKRTPAQTLNARYRIRPLMVVGSTATSEGVEHIDMLYSIQAEGLGRASDTTVTLEVLFARQQRAGI